MEELQKEIQRIKDQEKTWEFAEFNEETAWEMGLRLRGQAKEMHILSPFPSP